MSFSTSPAGWDWGPPGCLRGHYPPHAREGAGGPVSCPETLQPSELPPYLSAGATPLPAAGNLLLAAPRRGARILCLRFSTGYGGQLRSLPPRRAAAPGVSGAEPSRRPQRHAGEASGHRADSGQVQAHSPPRASFLDDLFPRWPSHRCFHREESEGWRALLEAPSCGLSTRRLSLPSRGIPAFSSTGSGCCPLTSPRSRAWHPSHTTVLQGDSRTSLV